MPWKRKATTSSDAAGDGPSPSKQAKSTEKVDPKLRFGASFYQKSCQALAKALLGKKLVHKLDDGETVAGDIVETEAYLGGEDKASHSYGGKKTAKNEAMFMDPGAICVYSMYGVLTCAKISSQGEGAAVLIRAVDPTHGQDRMRLFRGTKRPDKGKGLDEKDLGSGPSKLTQALDVVKATFNKANIIETDTMWIQAGFDVEDEDIVTSTRIGVEGHAEEWTDKPLRFYVKGNKSVSVRDKEAESGQKSETKASPKSNDVSNDKNASTAAESKASGSKKSSSPTASSPKSADVQEKKRLKSDFFQKSCVALSKALLGKKLVHKLENGDILAGDIVETEAYLGGEDKAAHSFEGKKTTRNEAMFMDPGTIYVYNIYGVMTCINFSSQGEGAAVLIRAVDATDGIDKMRLNRGVKRPDKGRGLSEKELGNGPSKLTQALSIEKATYNKEDVTKTSSMWLQPGFTVNDEDIVISSRIGIDSAGDWAKKPLRFYVKGNKSVSVRDKEAEK